MSRGTVSPRQELGKLGLAHLAGGHGELWVMRLAVSYGKTVYGNVVGGSTNTIAAR